MTAAADFPAAGGGPRAGLWLSAAVLALAVHGGAALWALRTPPPEALDAGAPAVMIEMAEAPAAAPPGETAPGDHLTDAPEIVETAQERLPDPTPPDLTLPEAAALPPQIPPPSPIPSPLSAPPAVLPEAVLPPPADRPRARPRDLRPAEVPPPPKPDPQPDPKPARERPPKAEVEAQAAAPQTAQTRAASQAASQAPRAGGAAAGGGGQADADWRARVIAHLMRLKRYPPAAKRRGDVGRVVLVLTIDPAGNVTGVRLKASSGSEILDQAALALALRVSPLPAPPPGALLSIIAPVDYASPR